MGTGNNSDNEITEAAHKTLNNDGYYPSHKVNYVPQILRWEMSPIYIK
jgi:hypothetical protein